MKKNNIIERLEKIKKDNEFLVNSAKKMVEDSNNKVSSCIDDLASAIVSDCEYVKRIESIQKTKQLIYDLTVEAINATTAEETIKIRNKLNYHINKLKKEMINRKMSEYKINRYSCSVADIRRNMSTLIRYKRRENKISLINELSKRIDTLSKEETLELKKLIRNELNYNKRNIKQMTDLKEAANSFKQNISVQRKQSSDVKDKKVSASNSANNEKNNTHMFGDIYTKVNDPVAFLDKKVFEYSKKYRLEDPLKYEFSFIKNIATLIKNLPIYLKNKKIIKYIKFQYLNFYRGEDLYGFIQYSEKKNSIKNALNIIFKNSSLSSRERDLLEGHNKCVEWILNYANGLDNLNNGTKTYRLTI